MRQPAAQVSHYVGEMMKIKMICLLVVLSTTGCIDNTPKPLHSREVPHVLSDGTPCIILTGGTHSGYIGLTCNYTVEKQVK